MTKVSSRGMCKLCSNEAELELSHVIPKFVGRWLKKTGITGYLREQNDVNKRQQDTAKEYWLCGACEDLFSKWETEFSKHIFYPIVDKGKSVISYGPWMSRFCASLSWRTLIYMRFKNEGTEQTAEYINSLNDAELHLRRFLLGKESNLSRYEQHLIPLEPIADTTFYQLPSNINRYFLRTMAMDIVSNTSDVFIYTKIPSFMLIGVIKYSDVKRMRSSRIAMNSGKISPREYHFPKGFHYYIFDKCEQLQETYKSISEQHQKSFATFIEKNPEKAAGSKLADAIRHDFDRFGGDIFK